MRLWLPACVAAAVMVADSPALWAQGPNRYRVVRAENFRREPRPDGRLLATLNLDTELVGDTTRAGWVRVTLTGWIWARSLREVNGGAFDREVVPRNGENLRSRPNGTVMARLAQGFRVVREESQGDWMRVSRVGWVWGRSLERLASETAATPSGSGPDPEPDVVSPDPVPPPPGVGLDYGVVDGRATLRRTADGDTTGTLFDGQAVQVLARSGDWVRVRAEGWVHESELAPGSDSVLLGVAAAEITARPDEFRGKLLQWVVQYISLKVADDLRPELPTGEPYMLARGPLPEARFIYVRLSREQARAFERIAPLAELAVLVRVVVGRSRFLGNPVVDLLEMRIREP